METYCGLALSDQRSGRYPGLCVQPVGSGLCGQQLRARDESALEVAPPDRRLDRRSKAFTTMRYTNRQPSPLPLPLLNVNYQHMPCRCIIVLQDCPPGSTDFRERQCSQFNGKHFNIHGLNSDVKWVAKYSASKWSSCDMIR